MERRYNECFELKYRPVSSEDDYSKSDQKALGAQKISIAFSCGSYDRRATLLLALERMIQQITQWTV